MVKSINSSAELAWPMSLQRRAALGERLSATRRPRRGSRPWITTLAPSVTQRRAMASPMPWVEPVMRMILSLRRIWNNCPAQPDLQMQLFYREDWELPAAEEKGA